MDPLEDFIRKNREAFDDKNVPARAWDNISRTIGLRERTVWTGLNMWRAAAVFFMISTAALLAFGYRNSIAGKSEQAIAATEFTDVEQFYVKQISEKVELIDKFQKNDGLNGFTQDFHQLEAMYNVLKEEMKNSPSEKVKDAMILNLLVRIDLLNQRLHKLEEEHKAETREESKRSV